MAVSVEELVTIRSRCRHVVLTTPLVADVAAFLVVREGLDAATAHQIAAASQGHIGRARALSRNPEARERRQEIARIPLDLRSLDGVMAAAESIVAEAQARSVSLCDELDATELANLHSSWGVQDKGKRPTGFAGALSSLTKDQESRRKRIARDEIDRVLLELMSVLRDVLSRQLETQSELINSDMAAGTTELAQRTTPHKTLESLDAITQCREALLVNAAPQIALERMFLRMVS